MFKSKIVLIGGLGRGVGGSEGTWEVAGVNNALFMTRVSTVAVGDNLFNLEEYSFPSYKFLEFAINCIYYMEVIRSLQWINRYDFCKS